MLWKHRSVTAVLALIACAVALLCARAYEDNKQIAFYLSLIAFSVFVWVLVSRIGLRASPALITATHAVVLIAVLLPAADFVLARSQAKAPAAKIEAAYQFRVAQANPEAFRAWWAYYVAEWTKPSGGKASTEKPDPKGVLPFVMNPNSTGRLFESVIRINNLGFRGSDFARDKGDKFRIFALGESPTFASSIDRETRPWPEALQTLVDAGLTCERRIEVINAGVEAYNLENNLERIRRDILPLKPDLVISYHGYNGLRFMGPSFFLSSPPFFRERPSALFGTAEYRARLALHQLEKWLLGSPTLPEKALLNTRYAKLYRELIGLGRENKFEVVLANSSMAVTASSPREVIDFYGRVFDPIDGVLAANAAHNAMVKKIAEAENVHFIDTTPNLAGAWDSDFFLDLVHFTHKGIDRIAQNMFVGLLPVLREDARLQCRFIAR